MAEEISTEQMNIESPSEETSIDVTSSEDMPQETEESQQESLGGGDPEKAKRLYDNLLSSKKFTKDELGSQLEFVSAISDRDKASKIYDGLSSAGFTKDEIGDKNEFLSVFSTQKFPQQTKQAAQKQWYEASALSPMSGIELQPKKEVDFEKVINSGLFNTKSDATRVVKPITEQAIKQVEQSRVTKNVAIDNTVDRRLKNKGITAPKNSPTYISEKKKVQQAIDDGDAIVSKNPITGEPVLAQTTGFWESLWNSGKEAVRNEEEADEFVNKMTTEQRVEYANRKAKEIKISPEGYVGEVAKAKPRFFGMDIPIPEDLAYAMGGGAQLTGGVAPFMAKATLGGLTGAALVAAAPVTGGASLAGIPALLAATATATGGFAATVGDMVNQGGRDEVMRRYMLLKERNPELPDIEAMKEAEKGLLSGEIAGGITNMAFMGAGGALTEGIGKKMLSNESKNVIGKYMKSTLKSASKLPKTYVGEALKSGVKMGAIISTTEAGKEIEAGLEDNKLRLSREQIIDNLANSFVENAKVGTILHALSTSPRLPGLIKSTFKGALAKENPAELAQTLRNNEVIGNIPPGSTERVMTDILEFSDALGKTSDGLNSDTKISVAGLIQKRDKLTAEMASKDPTQVESYKQQIDALDQQIKKITESNDPFEHEVNVVGEKLSTPSEKVYRVEYFDPEMGKMTHKLFPDEQSGTAFTKSLSGEQTRYGTQGYYEKYEGGKIEGVSELPEEIKTKVYDTENITGIPSKVGIGEELVQAQPIEGRGAQEISGGGVLQENVPSGEVKVEEKPQEKPLEAVEQKEVIRQMKPFTDRMAEIEREFKNNQFEIDTDYDNEIIVTDKKGEIVDAEELPDNLRKLAADYEKATSKLGDFDNTAMQKALAESRKVTETEAVEIKAELPEAEEIVYVDQSGKVRKFNNNNEYVDFLNNESYKIKGDFPSGIISINGEPKANLQPNQEDASFMKEYEKAKAEGSNPELVKAVEDALGKKVGEEVKAELPEMKKVKDIIKQVKGNVYRLSGNANAEARRFIIETLTGEKTSKSNAGVNRLMQVVEDYIGLKPDSQAGKESQINKWANEPTKPIREEAGRAVQPVPEVPQEQKIETRVQPSAERVSEGKPETTASVLSLSGVKRADAKKTYQYIRSMDEPIDAYGMAKRWLANGNKISVESFSREVSGKIRSRGEAKIKTKLDATQSEFTDSKSIKTVEKAAEEIWDDLREDQQESITDQDLRNSLIELLQTYNKRLDLAKDFISEYDAEKAAKEFYERDIEENKAAFEREEKALDDWYNDIASSDFEVLKNKDFINQLVQEYERDYPELFESPREAEAIAEKATETRKRESVEKISGGEGVREEGAKPTEPIKPIEPAEPRRRKAKEPGKFEQEATKIADKIKATELPKWLQTPDKDITKRGGGLSPEQLRDMLADAVVTMGKLMDKGVEFSQAVKVAVKQLIKAQGEENRDAIEKGFSEYYKANVGEKPPTERLPEMKIGEGELRGIRMEDNAERRAEIGMPERQANPESVEQWRAKAQEEISKGYNINKLIDKMDNGDMLSPVENEISRIFASTLDNEVKRNPSNENINAYKRFIQAREKASAKIGQSLRSLQGVSNPLENISDFFVAKMESLKVDELTESQIAETKKDFEKIQTAKEEYRKKYEEAEAKLSEIKAQNELLRQKKEKVQGKVYTQEGKRDFKAERENLKQKLRDAVQKYKNNANKLGISADGGAENFAISVDMAKIIFDIAKNHVDEVGAKLSEVTKRTLEDVKDIFDGITEKDIRDIIEGKYSKRKETKSELQANINQIRSEAKLLNELDRVLASEPKTEQQRIERNQELASLRKQINEVKKKGGLDEYSEEARIKRAIEANKRKEQELKERLDKGDFEPQEKKQSVYESPEFKKKYPKLYKELLDSRIAKEKAELEFNRKLIEEEMKSMSKFDKIKQALIKTRGTIKSFYASIDNSAVGVQVWAGIVRHPVIGVKSIINQIIDTFSGKSFERRLTELYESPDYYIMRDSGLSIYEPESLSEKAKDEFFPTRFKAIIKLNGKEYGWLNIGGKKYELFDVLKPFERAFTSLGNSFRVIKFRTDAQKLYDEGITFENKPEEFKALASRINALTSASEPGKAFKSGITNIAIWSPRLLATKLNILGISDLASFTPLVEKGYYRSLGEKGKVLSRQQLYAAADLARFATTVVAGSYLFASARGGKLNTDPYDDDFMDIELPNGKSYNFTGGFSKYIGTLFQFISGGEVSRLTGKYQKYSGFKDRGSEILHFMRGKMPPVSGSIVNLAVGKDYTGKETSLSSEAERFKMPMAISQISKQIDKDGYSALYGDAIPTFMGINVKDSRDYSKPKVLFEESEFNSPEMKILLDKDIVPAIRKKEQYKVKVDIKHPDGLMTDEEFDIFVELTKKYMKEGFEDEDGNEEKSIKGILDADYSVQRVINGDVVEEKTIKGKDLDKEKLSNKISSLKQKAINKAKSDMGFEEEKVIVKEEE